MATSTSVIVLLLNTFAATVSLKIETLDGEWTLQEATGKYNDLKAVVPGGVYTDLMNNKIIGDVFYGYNDTETRWVAQTNWTYTRNFIVEPDVLNHSNINLVFEGLDTFSTILINNIAIGASENMFRRYIFDVSSNLLPGNNTIEIRFFSPIAMAEALSSSQDYTVPPVCPGSQYRGECHVNQIRKMQASFSWDWGPAFPSMGIWKNVYLEVFNSSVIRYLVVDHNEAPNDSWSITISAYLSSNKGTTVQGKLIYGLETDVSVITQIVEVNRSNDVDEVKVDFTFTIPRLAVRRWWPNGYGEQKLYNLTANFESGSEVSSKTIKIGFRKIELVQEEISTNSSKSGLSFYFKVNDIAIFAKGANEIPLDILPERGQSPDIVTRVLQSAYVTNMNMLRVWGGGVYESDLFYQKTDELGILIWQDFMFACAMYPTYPEFLSNVKAEIQHQIKRLSSHPSIALWAGNNENEVALMTNWYGTAKNLTLYKNDYIKLYIDTIQNELNAVNSNLIFLTSSPSNGKESDQEGHLASNPQNPLYGDVHFYNYLTNSLDLKTYPVPRFASEFGYQSMPDVNTWMTATDNVTDLSPDSIFMDHRQHLAFGMVENSLLINYQLTLNSSSSNYYKAFIFYSQIVQAMSIKFETEYYRSFMGRLDDQGRGKTMGALFWQLNDVWVAPTWSGIGKWKMLQYFAKDFFAPSIVTGYLDTERQLRVYVMSETVSLIDSNLGVSVLVQIYNWASFEPVHSLELAASLEFGTALEAGVIDTDTVLAEVGCGSLSEAKNNCFFYLTLTSENVAIAPNNFVLATALKNSNLMESKVEISSLKQIDDKGTKFEITITADGVSLFVWLDSHQVKGRFSENGFIQVTKTKTITFQSEETTTETDLQNVLTVTHLKDPQYL